jgi:Ubiquitin family
VTLMHWTGDILSINKVKLGWSLDELKNHILKHHKISAKKEKVFFGGKELDAKRTLRQQGIQHRSILVMQSKNPPTRDLPGMEKLDFMAGLAALPTFLSDSISLRIRHWHGHEFVVKVQPSDYLDDVKDLIFDQKKIPVDHQRITFNGALVDETERLGDQGIANGCVLQLEPMKITIVQSSSGKEISLVVESDDTIREVKQQVFKRIKVPIELQCIVFGGEDLPDSKTLEECAVDHQETLQMEEFALSVVHWFGDVFRLSGLRPDSTISEVKSEILRVRYVPKKAQRLIFKGVTLQNNKTLIDESIKHKSVLLLEEQPETETPVQPRRLFNFMASLETESAFAPAMKVTVKQAGTGVSFSVGVDLKEYADDIREKIQREHRIPIKEQRLSLGGSPIREDLSLGDQGIVDGSVLQLDPMRVYLEKPSGDQVPLMVEKDWTIRYVKQKAIKGSSSDDFCVMFGGKELQDGETLEEYDIEHDSVLFLEVFKILIVDASGESPVQIPNVRRTSTVLSVKQSIAALKSIPVGRQQLSFQGKELSDKKTLGDHCIRHKSILALEEIEDMLHAEPVKSKFIFSTGNGLKPLDVKLATKVSENSLDDDGSHSDSDASLKRLDAVLAKIGTNGDLSKKAVPKVSVVKTTRSPPKAVVKDAKSSKSEKNEVNSSKSRPSECQPKRNGSSKNANVLEKSAAKRIALKTEKAMKKS